ncbi:MAG: response regulator, partial [Cyclobacteriaceae bacterium]
MKNRPLIKINLVSNALKFTKKGGVHIDLSARGLTSRRVSLTLNVRDTGVGIPEDKIRHIFEDFAQADSSTTREFGGTGLGLSIVRKIIEAQNGQLEVKSVVGEGTEFIISIPYTIGSESDLPDRPEEKSQPVLDGSRILVVDDQEFNRELVESILARIGASVVSCSNGLEAVEYMEKEVFDLVLMDIQMPGLSGIDAAKKIRSSAGLNQNTCIIALTAGSSEKEKQAILEAGMNDLLLKPFRQAELERILHKYLDQTRNKAKTPGPDLSELMDRSNGD